MSESICLQCGHKRICAMGINQPHENVTVTGCSRFKQKQPLTNADRIRAMTDEELAEALCLISGGQGPVSSADGRDWLDWLKQEAEE